MKTPIRVLAMSALLAAGATLASSAHAQGFSVVIDCHGNGGNPDWAKSVNVVSVDVRVSGENNGGWIPVGSIQTVRSGCPSDFGHLLVSSSFTAAAVTEIRLRIDGSDTFWVDKLQLWHGDRRALNSHMTNWWGVDNNVGWCLSTDPNDGLSAYCFQTEARTQWVFTK